MNPPQSNGVKCLCCRTLFSPSANNRGRQLFCSKSPCRKAAKARANRRWRDKNPDYDRGPEQVERVRKWRAINPGYSRAKKPEKLRTTLQDSAPSQAPADQLVSNTNPKLQSAILQSNSGPVPGAESRNGSPLQDFANIQNSVLYGLISVIMGDELQDSFEAFVSTLVERGRRVMAASPGGVAA